MSLSPSKVPIHEVAWYTAGFASGFAIYLSFRLISKHLANYTDPNVQRPIVRIIGMVPLYALFSWLSLRFKDHALYLDLIRDCYEAFILYSFIVMLTNYLGGERQLKNAVKKHLPIHHMFPMNLFLPDYTNEEKFVAQTRRWVLQYVVVKPLMAVLAIFLDEMGLYEEGFYSMNRGYIWITIVNSISVTFAMNGLIYIYHAIHTELEHVSPLWKLICVKGVLFLAFWQSVLISLLAKFGLIHSSVSWTLMEVETGLQDFVLCFEMVIAAYLHEYAYNWKEFATTKKSNEKKKV
eukprot:TRINITY_DN8065_c0_g1_i2.p1 TRINITY_DN8065_c0_g1~~TRINITY_DN8065_c0_g1_i2.p1  ORF type:complete len:293 (-),score=25.47 TRINITY_DN8065_c0_g1_i2:138-1016(-)